MGATSHTHQQTQQSNRPPPGAPSRLIAMGSAALVQGFALIGFEAYPDISPQKMEAILAELFRQRTKAFIVMEHQLAASGGTWLSRVLSEGGRIVVTEIPQLHSPEGFKPAVEAQVEAILGARALEQQS